MTNKAGASWHFYMLFPYAYYVMIDLFPKFIFEFLPFLFFAINVFFIYNLNNGRLLNKYWSRSVFSLVEHVKKSDSKFVSVDWGINNELIAFDHIKNKYYDYWPFFCTENLEPKTQEWIRQTYLVNAEYRYVRVVSGDENVTCGKNFEKLINSFGYSLQNEVSFPENNPEFLIQKIVVN